MGSRLGRGSVTAPMVAASRGHDTRIRTIEPNEREQMAARRTPEDDYSRVMDVVARVSRLTGVTTSVLGVVLAAGALVAIAVALIMSL
jgi:hypothetical protein